MPPQVNVVVTNYNYVRFVGAAIDSALRQDGVCVEVIVVDDGSTDGSRDVIEAYGDAVVACFTANGGQAAAFDAGWARCTAPVVMFLDADDVLHPHIAAACHDAIVAGGASRVQFPLAVIDSDGRPTGDRVPTPGKRLFSGDARAALARCPDDIVWQPTSGNAFSATALRRIMPMPVEPYRLCADYYLSNLAPLHGPVVALDAVGGEYRVHGGNLHFRRAESIGSIVENVRRTSRTHADLIAHCLELGVRPPADRADDVRSVSSAAHRLISLRLAGDAHPIAHDSRTRVVSLGLRSARARVDVGVARRLLFAAWFVVAAAVPRALVRRVARPLVAIV